MSEATVAPAKRFVDPQRVQRRLKAADFVVLLIATMGVFLGSSLWIPAHAVSLIGFFALEVAFGSVLMMNWVGLYGLDTLLVPGRGIVAALTVTVGLGAVAFLITHLGLFALEPWWLSGWAVLCAVHFTLTRMAAYLWARPKAAAGAFRQRVAVVGWGEDADDAVRLLAEADPMRLEVVGLFSRFEAVEVAIQEAHESTRDEIAHAFGVKFKEHNADYITLAELRLYTHRVAGVVGLWLSRLFGVHDVDVLERADRVGTSSIRSIHLRSARSASTPSTPAAPPIDANMRRAPVGSAP